MTAVYERAAPAFRPREESDGRDMSEPWDVMLTLLATERARHLVADAIETLEQVVPTADSPTGTALNDLRDVLRQLGVS